MHKILKSFNANLKIYEKKNFSNPPAWPLFNASFIGYTRLYRRNPNPKEKKKKINEQVNKEIALVRKEKKKNKIDKPKKSNIKLKVGDSVRMFDGRSVGSIDLIEKNKAIVNYGVFKTQVSLDLLEIVEDKQTKK